MNKYSVWDTTLDLRDILRKYVEIENRQKASPVTLELPEPPEKPPRVDGERQRFFDPSLQQQRNIEAYEQIPRDKGAKLAILGCGELSFEKYAMKDLPSRGINHIVSVDIDEEPLSCGLKYMSRYLDHNEEYTLKRNYFPIHHEVFKGDIMTPTPVLSNVDIVISTEVIEHMPLEKATELLKCVLEKIKPQKFILSTPNFEYNVAFNKQTSFRHDDHHFEFTRAEFKEWLNDNVHPPYSYNIVYVGQLDGYQELEGATQFAEITRDDGVSGTVITENEGKYEKVADYIYRASYYRLFEAIVVGSFKEFLNHYPFDKQQLTSVGNLKFWRIPLSRILQYRARPTIEIEEEGAMLMITRLFSLVCYNSVDPETDRPAISISATTDKNEVIRTVSKTFG
ncbi:henn-1 [Pristionchus pacificus]|uniref:Small RNA 2'-O-methyltransferase n=1 Tax=Pristionchus pacificus TaxID=54126 RepID=A0A8R1Y7Y9_PRIPA|nr:henn-1 [Pristionchus pacificus]